MNRQFIGTLLSAAIAFVPAARGQNASGPFETTSLLGRQLYALPDDATLAASRQKLAADPKNVNLVLALSNAQAARRQYEEAVITCTAGLKFAPDNADLLLERGHRKLGLREFSAAQADLERAAKLNPEQLNNFYHLGLAFYFQQQFTRAAESFHKALSLARNSDSVIDCSNWLYVSLRRAGDKVASGASSAANYAGCAEQGTALAVLPKAAAFLSGRGVTAGNLSAETSLFR